MRTTIALDDDLMARAEELTGITEKAALIREALKTLIAREAARRLILLGGSDPTAEVPPSIPRTMDKSSMEKTLMPN